MLTAHMGTTTLLIVLGIVTVMFIAKLIHNNGVTIVGYIIGFIWITIVIIFATPFVLALDILAILIYWLTGRLDEFESLTINTIMNPSGK